VGPHAAPDRRFAIRVAVAVVCLCACLDAIAGRGFSSECDNPAGTCIRGRQAVAILVIDFACLAAAGYALTVAVRWVSRRRLSARLAWTALALCTALAVVVLAVEPGRAPRQPLHRLASRLRSRPRPTSPGGRGAARAHPALDSGRRSRIN
jgi:hypothetical protein